MAKQQKSPISRRTFIAGSGALAAGTMGFPLIGGAQPAPVKVGLIHPLTGFVGFNGSQLRLGSLMAIEDINKAGGIKSMGGAKLDPLLGDSQSKVEVGVAEVEKMNEQGVAVHAMSLSQPMAYWADAALGDDGIVGPKSSWSLGLANWKKASALPSSRPKKQWQYVRSSPKSSSDSHHVATSGRPSRSS